MSTAGFMNAFFVIIEPTPINEDINKIEPTDAAAIIPGSVTY